LYDFFRRSGLSERARRALDAARARDAAHHHRRSPGRSSGKEDDT
jgi:hypothetical protein